MTNVLISIVLLLFAWNGAPNLRPQPVRFSAVAPSLSQYMSTGMFAMAGGEPTANSNDDGSPNNSDKKDPPGKPKPPGPPPPPPPPPKHHKPPPPSCHRDDDCGHGGQQDLAWNAASSRNGGK